MSNAVAAVAAAAAPSEPEWAAFAAIDWADQKNFWRLLPAGSRQSEAGELDSTPEAVEVWAAHLQLRFGGRPIAVILEQTRGPLVYMLTKYPHLVLFPVHPTTAARYRETFAPSGAKSDPSDTDSLLDLLLRHRERLRPLRPDTVETRLLHFLVEERRQTVDEKTRANLRLTDCLKLYFPQVLRWFDDVTSPLVGDLLRSAGTLADPGATPAGASGNAAPVFSRAQLPERGKERGTHSGHPTSHLRHARRGGAGGLCFDRPQPGGDVGDTARPNRCVR